MKIKVGINLLDLYPGKIGGMEHYFRNLLDEVLKISPNYYYYLFVAPHNSSSFTENENVDKILIDQASDSYLVIKKINELELDLWFCPLLVLSPLHLNIPSVINIPDIQHEFYPEFFSPEVLEWRYKNFKLSAEKANAVLTLSQYSKDTIVEKYGISQDKVFSIHLDAGREFHEPFDGHKVVEARNKYHLPSKFAFFPANTWPHKNHKILVQALKILKEKFDINLPLVLTGAKSNAHNDILGLISQLDLDNQIHFLDYIPQQDMPYIYKNASFLVFPSLFEGFGIPLVEAMKTGCPIIAANTTSIPEVLGDAGIIFNAQDAEELASTMNKMITDESTYKDFIDIGLKRGKEFSWKICAEETLKVFEKAVKEGVIELSEFPLVSVVTPSYNQGKFIRETIDSVLNQDYPNLEYIVIDGGSTDETVDILKSFNDPRFKWVSEPDEGQADAVNKGFKMAQGQILGWLNSDDTYLPGAIKEAVKFLTIHPDVGIVYGEGFHTKENGEHIDRYPTEPFNLDRLAETCYICQPTAFIGSWVFDRIQLDKTLHLCMDYDYWIRVAMNGIAIVYTPFEMATSRLYEDNKTLSRRDEVFREIFNTVKKHYGYLPFSWIWGYVTYKTESYPYLPIKIFYAFLSIIFHNYQRPGYIKTTFRNIIKHLLITRRVKTQKGILREHQGYHGDGWVEPRSKFLFDAGNGASKLIIEGKHTWPYKESMDIEIYVNSQKVDSLVINKRGSFKKVLAIPPVSGLVEIECITNKGFIPNEMGFNDDKRQLAFILNSIQVC